MTNLKSITIALISITLLGLELVWTRIFSAEFFYAFAFLTLSLAIMGIGLGALALRLIPVLNREGSFGAMLTLSGLTALVGPPAVIALGLDFSLLFSSGAMLAKFILTIIILSSAFFFGGVALAYLFRNNHENMPRLYMADLIGAGVGVLASILIMNLFGTPAATFLIALPMLAAAVLNTRGVGKAVPALLFVGAMFLPSHAAGWLRADREEPAPVIYEHWDAMAKLKIYDFEGQARGFNIDNVANTPLLNFDGDFKALDTTDLGWDISVAYLAGLFDSCTFLSLGSGAGGDVLQALDIGAKEIYAVEVLPQINHLMLHDDTCGFIDPPPQDSTADTTTQIVADSAADTVPAEPKPPVPVIRDSLGQIVTCAKYSGYLYSNPRVHAITEDARTFVRRYPGRFDIIYSWSSNTWAALGSGSFALSENYIFTKEAFQDYWRALSDSGFLCMEHQMYMPRLLTEVMEALTELGVTDVKSHFAIYTLPQQRRKILLLSKRPLTEEITAHAFGPLTLERAETIHLLYPAPDSLQSGIYSRIVNEGWRAVTDSVKINLSPCTDDRPFIAQLGLWKNFSWDKLGKISNYAEFGGFPLSRIIMLIILAVAVVVLLPLNLIPYLLKGPRLRAASWLYFFAIGVAFMVVEVVLIQKYALYIGASVYSIATVLLTLLVGSGIGSRFARHAGDHVPFLGIIIWLGLDALLFGHITGALVQLEVVWRVLVVVLLVLPLGFFMGMPFPKGTLRVGELVDWGFSVNGAASVLGATGAIMIAIDYGFTLTLLIGGAVYLLAWGMMSLRKAW
jgi:hypothetical protein